MEKILKVCELSIKYKTTKKVTMPIITSSDIAVNIFKSNWKEDIEHRESAYLLVLDKGNAVKGIFTISIGGVSGTVVDSKLIFQTILLCNGSSFIVAHNHPSGKINESIADTNLCKKLKKQSEIMDLSILDFLIITKDNYKSFADNDLL